MKNGVWTAFFPIGIYGDWWRNDWNDYSIQGFNTQMWSDAYNSVQRAKDAGLMSNLLVWLYLNHGFNVKPLFSD